MDTRKLIQQFVDTYREDIVLDLGFDLVKLLGWSDEVDDEDYYYIVWSSKKKKVIYESCVGRLIPLSSLKEYGYIKSIWELNNSGEDVKDWLENTRLKIL